MRSRAEPWSAPYFVSAALLPRRGLECTYVVICVCHMLRWLAGGKIGLIDYGQSKRLPEPYRAAFAQLVLQVGGRCTTNFAHLVLHVGGAVVGIGRCVCGVGGGGDGGGGGGGGVRRA